MERALVVCSAGASGVAGGEGQGVGPESDRPVYFGEAGGGGVEARRRRRTGGR